MAWNSPVGSTGPRMRPVRRISHEQRKSKHNFRFGLVFTVRVRPHRPCLSAVRATKVVRLLTVPSIVALWFNLSSFWKTKANDRKFDRFWLGRCRIGSRRARPRLLGELMAVGELKSPLSSGRLGCTIDVGPFSVISNGILLQRAHWASPE